MIIKGVLKVRGKYFGTGKQIVAGEDEYEEEDKDDLG